MVSHLFGFNVPHPETIRTWVYRFGLGALKSVTISGEWVMIVDCSGTYGNQWATINHDFGRINCHTIFKTSKLLGLAE